MPSEDKKCIQTDAFYQLQTEVRNEKFKFESGEISLLRQKLGLSGASSSTISSENLSVSAASSKKSPKGLASRHKGRPGVRQPNRDVIGGT